VDQAALNRARELLERASEMLRGLDEQEALTTFAAMKQHRVAAGLATASLERAEAELHAGRALELAVALATNRRLARDLLPAWTLLLFGELSPALQGQARELLDEELRTATLDATIGLARASRQVDDAREALRICREEGLPDWASVLALHDVVAGLPPGEVDGAVADCLAAASRLADRVKASWTLALRAAQAAAHLRHGARAASRAALDAVQTSDLERPDGIALSLFVGAEVRTNLAMGLVREAREGLVVFLHAYAEMVRRLAGTAHQLPFRAACEPVFSAALADAAAWGPEPAGRERRRAFALLLDALRAPDEIPDAPTLRPLLLRGTTPDAMTEAAYDRIGRLVHAVGARPGVVVLVAQHLGEGSLLLCVGGDAVEPLVSAMADAKAQSAMTNLMGAAERAVRAPEADETLAVLGRAAFDALPAEVRRRIEGAETVLVVPDFGAGQDRVPLELLHDGRGFLGTSRVIARCLSIAHALRVLEAPLAPPRAGVRALCVAVARPPGLPPLRGAEEELTLVEGALRWAGWDVQALRESEADPGAVLELAPLTNVLHVACHGEASAGAEALVLGDGARLIAVDVAGRHRLGGLVYLNACSLARGRYLGGGESRGMAYAFARAGAWSVVASLLPVEDASAARIARAFYAGGRREAVGEALRRARAEVAAGGVRPAHWSMTVLVGDPFLGMDGTSEPSADATAELLRDGDGDQPARLTAAREQLARTPTDVRLEAAVAWADAMLAPGGRDLDAIAAIAREIGHPVGEAQCLLALVEERRDAGDPARLEPVLRRAVGALAPLRGTWQPAWEAHRRLQEELRRLDPTFEARELPVVRMPSGLTINDRSDPAIAALLGMQEAMDEGETFWRGEPTFRVPDRDLSDVAWNAVVWGHRYRLYGTGAEADYAAQCAARLVWRGAVPGPARANLARILGGVLPFVWGQQRITHLDHWMATAHADVVRLLVESVARSWVPAESSPAAPWARAIEAALEQATTRPAGSKYARARAALAGAEPPAARVEPLEGTISDAIGRCRELDRAAAAELAAWSLGLLAERAATAGRGDEPRQNEVLALRTLYDRLAVHVEGWIEPYLWEGFREVRETGGMDRLDRWRHSVL
jgi:CHAT domain-containing protein